MIQLQDIRKTFATKDSRLEALRGVSLHIDNGESFGIIGYSGAGNRKLKLAPSPRRGIRHCS
ncbi:hypothetical protein EDC14_105029 [Hydrogenispora ethanolica]|uniref:ABC transporter family protein n=1 Tax=Hydrogenispora ethanolica TaxID=1082276 RepID=A0A4R1QV78_HYDET|nr:hypothetical protein [Hydrogenispora ethanolica]TCL56475.1 hypothetical protein EDC14_105029 [Hydrogenispora ethanolica]